mmetsp:Transcript_461/g.1398  ORF Transcript_461/g.1398 Transcript_461/m.1398 type:complete len:294 (+) Transcript_461:1172-2053(+)
MRRPRKRESTPRKRCFFPPHDAHNSAADSPTSSKSAAENLAIFLKLSSPAASSPSSRSPGGAVAFSSAHPSTISTISSNISSTFPTTPTLGATHTSSSSSFTKPRALLAPLNPTASGFPRFLPPFGATSSSAGLVGSHAAPRAWYDEKFSKCGGSIAASPPPAAAACAAAGAKTPAGAWAPARSAGAEHAKSSETTRRVAVVVAAAAAAVLAPARGGAAAARAVEPSAGRARFRGNSVGEMSASAGGAAKGSSGSSTIHGMCGGARVVSTAACWSFWSFCGGDWAASRKSTDG